MSPRDEEMFEKIAAADEAGKGLRLTATEVGDLFAAISEMDLQRTLDAMLFQAVVRQLTGEEPAITIN